MKFRLRTTPTAPAKAIQIAPMRVSVRSRALRVLDFDVEARPLHWINSEYVSKEITAMAWAWCDEPQNVTCYLLGETDPRVMLCEFVAAYNQADIVTGHFIRGYDLPMVQGALTEYQLPVLGKKLTQDTKIDLVRRQGLSSSQENLGAMLNLEHDKVKMDQRKWRDANRLTPEGLAEVRKRVIGDVQQHIEMRQRLIGLGYLGPSVMWKSGVAQAPIYTP